MTIKAATPSRLVPRQPRKNVLTYDERIELAVWHAKILHRLHAPKEPADFFLEDQVLPS